MRERQSKKGTNSIGPPPIQAGQLVLRQFQQKNYFCAFIMTSKCL